MFPVLFTWGQTVVEVMKIMVTSLKRSHACNATLSSPDPAVGHRWPTPSLTTPNTQGQVWVSLLWVHCSFLLGPGAQGSVCACQESISQSCVSSGGSMVGLMAISSKRTYATPRSAASRAPALQQATADLDLHRRHSNTVCLSSFVSLLPNLLF